MIRLSLLVLILTQSEAIAQEHRIEAIAPLMQNGWQELQYDDKIANRWSAKDGELIVETDKSVSTLYYETDVDPHRFPDLVWSWRVDKSPGTTDLSKKGGDDRAIAIDVVFAFDEENSSLLEKVKRQALTILNGGEELPGGRIISYVFGGMLPRGSVYENPYAGSCCRHKVLRKLSDTTVGLWVQEQVDLAGDYEKEFGTPATRITRIAISADSDDTGLQTLARIKDIEFVGK